MPAQWVHASRRERFAEVAGADQGYGYQWWVQPFGTYAAEGSGGQYIFVAPGQDVVAVFTADLPEEQTGFPLTLVQPFLLAAVKSGAPLAANPSGLARLEAFQVQAQQEPAATPPGPLPPVAAQIQGQTYLTGANPFGWETLTFRFQTDTASIETFDGNARSTASVGLDGRFRFSALGGGTGVPGAGRPDYAARGGWTDEKTFEVEGMVLGEATARYTFTFAAGAVTVQIQDRSGFSARFGGRLQP